MPDRLGRARFNEPVTEPRRTTARGLRSDAHNNRERITEAAVAAFHRDGLTAPMATIAAEAGVGVGTLYRHFPTRDDLLDELTYRSFGLMLGHLESAAGGSVPATEVLRTFLAGVIADRDALVLPSTGGPPARTPRTLEVQRSLHAAIRAVLSTGADDGSIRREVDVWDIAWLGATLAPPGRPGPTWDAIARRLLDTYLAGLGAAP
jgi:AcrR family transcriptional regulator